MLRSVVGTFLDSLTEREFDAPLLALLTVQGFSDIHFIHGGFEFGKDVIAKRVDPSTGATWQFAIQSKAGDINQGGWRAVRPQLEECEYNTRAHPNFDATLPRAAVLVTTGRLTGAAPVDAQEYKASCRARGIADFDVWDRETILDWITTDPAAGFAGATVEHELLAIIAAIGDHTITEPALERYTRRWLEYPLPRACIEAAVLTNALRTSNRIDLACLSALHLLRAGHTDQRSAPPAAEQQTSVTQNSVTQTAVAAASVRLFRGCASELLDSLEPLLDDPLDLARPATTLTGAATYPAMCLRLIEIVSLLAVTPNDLASSPTADTDTDCDDGLAARGLRAAELLATLHPGASRPPSDAFASSIAFVVAALAPTRPTVARAYLRQVATWIEDRHDPEKSGLGLGSHTEGAEVVVERLIGGSLTTTTLERQRSSQLLTAVLDCLIVLGEVDLYEAVRQNAAALRVTPTCSYADESVARWRRSGAHVWPQPRVVYASWSEPRPAHHDVPDPMSMEASVRNLLLEVVSRTRPPAATLQNYLSQV